MTDDKPPEIHNVVCYDSVAKEIPLLSRWRVRKKEKRGKGKVVLILERVKK